MELDEDHSRIRGLAQARPGAASARGASDGAGGAAVFNRAKYARFTTKFQAPHRFAQRGS